MQGYEGQYPGEEDPYYHGGDGDKREKVPVSPFGIDQLRRGLGFVGDGTPDNITSFDVPSTFQPAERIEDIINLVHEHSEFTYRQYEMLRENLGELRRGGREIYKFDGFLFSNKVEGPGEDHRNEPAGNESSPFNVPRFLEAYNQGLRHVEYLSDLRQLNDPNYVPVRFRGSSIPRYCTSEILEKLSVATSRRLSSIQSEIDSLRRIVALEEAQLPRLDGDAQQALKSNEQKLRDLLERLEEVDSEDRFCSRLHTTSGIEARQARRHINAMFKLLCKRLPPGMFAGEIDDLLWMGQFYMYVTSVLAEKGDVLSFRQPPYVFQNGIFVPGPNWTEKVAAAARKVTQQERASVVLSALLKPSQIFHVLDLLLGLGYRNHGLTIDDLIDQTISENNRRRNNPRRKIIESRRQENDKRRRNR